MSVIWAATKSNLEKSSLVHKTFADRRRKGSLQYLVQWKGFGPEECSWEKDSDVHAPRLVKAFHDQFPQKPRPSGPVAPRGGGVLSWIGDAPYLLLCGGVLPPGAANPRWRRPGLHVGARTPAPADSTGVTVF
uniref:Chromo domain-containing protein n=1 Tax=Xenopus tropicalis TaxID=8364 RepID=A0A803J8D0_XENTR